MVSNILVFIATLPDNIRAGLAILAYFAAYLLLTLLSSTGGKKHDRT